MSKNRIRRFCAASAAVISAALIAFGITGAPAYAAAGHAAASTLPATASSKDADTAAALLKSTIEQVISLVNETDVYDDYAHIPEGVKWVSSIDYEKILKSIDSAQDMLEDSADHTADEIDRETMSLADAYLQSGGFEDSIKTVEHEETVTGDPFKRNSLSEEDAAAIIRSGDFYINEYMLPDNEASFDRNYPDGFEINGRTYSIPDGTSDYYDRCISMIRTFPAETVYYLADLDGDDVPDRVSAYCYEPFIVKEITEHKDGTYTILRETADADSVLRSETGSLFLEGEEKITAAGFDGTIEEGETAQGYYARSGWVITRAVQIDGTLDSFSKNSCEIDGETYSITRSAEFANMITSNRADVLGNALSYFAPAGETGVTLWTLKGDSRQILTSCALMIRGDASACLEAAADTAKERLESVTVYETEPEDPEDLSESWISQAEYDTVNSQILKVQDLLKEDEPDLRQAESSICSLYAALDEASDDLAAGFGHSDAEAAGAAREQRTERVLKSAEKTLLIIFIIIAVIVAATAVYVYIGSKKKRNPDRDGQKQNI